MRSRLDTENLIEDLIGEDGLDYEGNDRNKYLRLLKESHENNYFLYTDNLLEPKMLLFLADDKIELENGKTFIEYYFANLKPTSIVEDDENDKYIIEGFNGKKSLGGIVIGENVGNEDNKKIKWTNDSVLYELTGGKRKSVKRKSTKRKLVKRKSTKRKLVKRKSIKRKSVKRKSIKRKSVKRKSTKRKSVKRKSRKSVKKKSIKRKSVYMTKKKCKSLLSKQIKKNSKKYSNHKQAIAIAYSQIKRKHKNCKKHFK